MKKYSTSDLSRSMVWFSDKSPIPIRFMDSLHIKKVINIINNSKGYSYFNYTSKEWLDALKSELSRREMVTDIIFNRLSEGNNIFSNIIKQEKHGKYIKRT